MAELILLADAWRQPVLDDDGEPTKKWHRRRQGDVVIVPDDMEENFLAITTGSETGHRPMFKKKEVEAESEKKKTSTVTTVEK